VLSSPSAAVSEELPAEVGSSELEEESLPHADMERAIMPVAITAQRILFS